jgi:hypothetical protein
VFITLFGDNGDSGERKLDGQGNLFERNETNSFQVEAVDMGELKKIIIGHDNSGLGPGWFLEKVRFIPVQKSPLKFQILVYFYLFLGCRNQHANPKRMALLPRKMVRQE